MISIMRIPAGFKIKKKVDVERFIDYCMKNDNEYEVVISVIEKIVITKNNDGNVSFSIKIGDIKNIFIPLVEVANTGNNAYKNSVNDYIWKYRKYINTKWFND